MTFVDEDSIPLLIPIPETNQLLKILPTKPSPITSNEPEPAPKKKKNNGWNLFFSENVVCLVNAKFHHKKIKIDRFFCKKGWIKMPRGGMTFIF